ncbi:unnamed protein product [Amaranthus hypochondriacus]
MHPSERERRAGWASSKSFFRKFKYSNFNFQAGRQSVSSRSYGYNGYSWPGQRPSQGVYGGLRGGSRHLGWCGPRFQPNTGFGYSERGVFSLFIDGICSSTSTTVLKLIFNGIGVVVDAFISRKSRPSRKDRFGFVRFRYREEAERAIKVLNGQSLDGGILLVSKAKYKRGGVPFKSGTSSKRVFSPSFDGSSGVKDSQTGREATVLGKNDSPILSSTEDLPQVTVQNKEKGDTTIVDLENEQTVANGEVSAALKKNLVIDSSPHQEPQRDNVLLSGEDRSLCLPGVDKEVILMKSDAVKTKRCENTKVSPTKKPKGKRKMLNSKEIAEYLGFFTSGPSQVDASRNF